mgnify:CR=1 FL=1
MTVSEAKQTQRKAGRAARKALGPEERKAANAALCAFLWQLAAVQNAQTILLYAAFGSEADLSALAEKAQAQGKTLAYPVCGEAYSLTAAVPGPDGWETGLYGIRTPVLERSVLLEPEQLDLVLVMSVEPGFGGQKFMPSALEKLRWLKEERAKRSARYLLEVDGGVDDTTPPCRVEAGADILVAGSAVFGAADPAAAVHRLAAL